MYKLVRHEFGFLAIDPTPSEQEVERYYLEEFYSNPQVFNDSSLEVQNKQDDFFTRRYDFIFERCKKLFQKDLKGETVWDIGCGYGLALKYFLDKGLKAFGNEPSREGCEHARFLGASVTQTGIEEIVASDTGRFGIVLCLDVLEHLRDPVASLLKVRENLMNEESILVIDVPNEFNTFQVVANDEFDLKEWWVSPPRHLNYFSASSLTNTLEKCGFEVLALESSFPLEIFLLLGFNYVGNQEIGSDVHQRRNNFEKLMVSHGKKQELINFYGALAELDLGRQVTAYCRKKSDYDSSNNLQ